ncbi:MAG: helix-turn-helix domain-containing protein [Streptosporangiales bacterium]|nr:helix-turn-helix domain-containing protein [Streptosporangiales bacterium]
MARRPIVPLEETHRSSGTEAAARVADVLLLFTRGPASLGVSAIARELGLSKAVVHRILQSLASRQVVELHPDGHGYQLGRAAVALGARAMRDLDLRRAARPVLRRLREETQETTSLSELLGTARVYLDQFEGPQEVKVVLELGRPHQLHAGGSGKVILAFLPAETRERILAGSLEHVTPKTVTDPGALRAELEEIAKAGYAGSIGERQRGVGSVAAPVFGMDGDVLGAVSVCGPTERFDAQAIEEHAPKVRKAAEEVSKALGWTGPVSS